MKHELTFGIIGAMDSEIRRLLEAADDWQTQDRAGLTFYAGTRAGQRLVLVKSGIGKVNAARCAQILLDCYAPDYLINTGIAGGDVGYILARCGLLVALGVIGLACSITAQYFAARASVGWAVCTRSGVRCTFA